MDPSPPYQGKPVSIQRRIFNQALDTVIAGGSKSKPGMKIDAKRRVAAQVLAVSIRDLPTEERKAATIDYVRHTRGSPIQGELLEPICDSLRQISGGHKAPFFGDDLTTSRRQSLMAGVGETVLDATKDSESPEVAELLVRLYSKPPVAVSTSTGQGSRSAFRTIDVASVAAQRQRQTRAIAATAYDSESD